MTSSSALQLMLIPHQTRDGLVYQHLRICILTANGVLSPSDLTQVSLPSEIKFSQGIVIEGRGPIWLYGFLVHLCHPATWIGCYEPRQEGCVVVQTHVPDIQVGQLRGLHLNKIPINLE
jgi:CRISPR-associated protein Csx3